MTSGTTRDACLRGFLELLAEKPFRAIDLAEVAQRSGVPLGEMRAAFSGPEDLLAAFYRDIDRHVLAEVAPGEDGFAREGERERLFEVLMRRIAALEPHKAAVKSLARSACTDPPLAVRLLRLAMESQRYMLAAAGIPCTGLSGAVRTKALALGFAKVVETWLGEDDPHLPRTMAALDRVLACGETLEGMVRNVAAIFAPARA